MNQKLRKRCMVRKPSHKDPIAIKNVAKAVSITAQFFEIGARMGGAAKPKIHTSAKSRIIRVLIDRRLFMGSFLQGF